MRFVSITIYLDRENKFFNPCFGILFFVLKDLSRLFGFLFHELSSGEGSSPNKFFIFLDLSIFRASGLRDHFGEENYFLPHSGMQIALH